MDNDKLMMTVAVLGGTGKEGSGLALRWANSGYHIIIGSRDAERAQTKAAELNELINGNIEGMSNQDAVTKADIVVLTVPYDAHKATLESVRNEVQGKILVDVTVPMQPPDIRKVYVPTGHAASLEAQSLLGDGVKVVSAFQNVSASHLKKLDHEMACDVLVTGDDEDAKTHTIHLVEAAGMRGIDAGPLVNAVAAEALTPVLMYINKKYAVKGAGIHITGIATEE